MLKYLHTSLCFTCLNCGWETIWAQSSNPFYLWNYISAHGAQGSNHAGTLSPGFPFPFLWEKNKGEKNAEFCHCTSYLWEEALVVRINGAATDLLKSVSIIIWQRNTSSHITHAFANWHSQNQSGTKLERLYFWVLAHFTFFLIKSLKDELNMSHSCMIMCHLWGNNPLEAILNCF